MFCLNSSPAIGVIRRQDLCQPDEVKYLLSGALLGWPLTAGHVEIRSPPLIIGP